MSLTPASNVDDTTFDSGDDDQFIAVMREVGNITDWSVLPLLLGVDSAEIDTIKANYSNLQEQRKAFIQAWIDTDCASWAMLVSALRDSLVKKKAIANQIAKKYPPGSVVKKPIKPVVPIQRPAAPVKKVIVTHQATPQPIVEPPPRKGLNQVKVNTMKAQIEARLSEPEFKRTQGIIFVVGVFGADGTAVDVANVHKTFRELDFAVYEVRDPLAEDIACLIQAAADVEYPFRYEYVAFYFAGHGGRDKDGKMFIVGLQLGDDTEVLHIEEYVINPLKCLHEKKLSRLFFFDCCQSEGKGTAFRDAIIKKPKPNPGELMAYATNEGEKSFGDRKNGGIWTYNLCKNLREMDDAITTVLAKTFDDVVNTKETFQQPTVTSSLGLRKLRKKPAAGGSGNLSSEEANPELDSRSLLKKTPELDDLVNVITSDCDNLTLRESLKLPATGDLKSALNTWIRSETTDVTWEVLLKALKSSSNVGVLRSILDDYLKKPSVHQRYSKKADYTPLDF